MTRPKRAPRRRKLTESIVRSLPPGPPVWDQLLPGFGIRVGKNVRTWVVATVRPGAKHPVVLKIGRFPQTGLADARTKAREMLSGEAPAAPVAFGKLVEQFLSDGRTRGGRPMRSATLRAYTSVLQTGAKTLHDRPVDSIRRRDIAALTRRVASETGPAHAALTKAALGRFWSWLAENDLAESDPVRGSPSFAIPKRDRVLSDAEIRALWHCKAAGADVQLIMRFLLWTGAREQEIGGIRDSELRDGTWTLPPERAKNGRGLVLPLARQTVAALDAWPRITTRGGCLFGIRSRNGFTAWSRAKRDLDTSLRFNKLWQFRDCRRTVETGMAGLRIDKMVVSRILNHGVSALTERYDRHHYLDEKRDALQRWADRLDQIVCSH
jgi:integrase